jgi:hypothetical protein
MNRIHRWCQGLIVVLLLGLSCRLVVFAADDATLTKEQITQFLLNAKIVQSHDAKKGITHTLRLTLSDGTVTHDASFQSIEEHKAAKNFAAGTELNFVDSYRYNLAAYRLAELIGMDNMIPVYVERKYKGESGSLSWWLPVKMDEVERYQKNITPPDLTAWNNQMYKIRVFDELIYDSDANLTNVLIGPNWEIWRIDFTRAFRDNKDLKEPKNLTQCERHLFEKLKALDANELAAKTKGYLNKVDVEAVMARRDKIVAQFQKMISEKGESAVLY